MPKRVEPTYAGVLLDAIHAENEKAGKKPHAFDTPFRHSDGGACARFLGMSYMGIPESDPFDPASEYTAWVGTQVHERWQESLGAQPATTHKHGDCVPVAEHPVHDDDGLASGSLDLWDDENGGCIEAKTVNGGKFQYATGIIKGMFGRPPKRQEPRGPDASHVIQMALNTIDSGADWARIFYLTTEALSLQVFRAINELYPDEPMTERDRFCAEWEYTRAELEPIAERELVRLAAIKATVDDGVLPAPYSVGDGFALEGPHDPVDTDFPCLYCTRRTACLTYEGPTEEDDEQARFM